MNIKKCIDCGADLKIENTDNECSIMCSRRPLFSCFAEKQVLNNNSKVYVLRSLKINDFESIIIQWLFVIKKITVFKSINNKLESQLEMPINSIDCYLDKNIVLNKIKKLCVLK